MFEMNRLLLLAVLVCMPAGVFAESATPSIGYTGAPTDHGGQDCSTCHNSFGAANSDKTGSLKVTVSDYVPTVQQLIHIVVQNPNAPEWGFQITIREQSDETLSSGTFAVPNATAPVQVVCDDGSQFGSPAPCAGNIARQFAEHLNAPRGTTGTAYEFDVLWTPPSQEIGRLQVYVAAVAANGDGTPQGDRVYTFTQPLANAGACALGGQPVFQSVLNGASFEPNFSSGAMVSIFGSGFQTSGRQRIAGLGDYVNGAFPTELGCVGVEVTGPGVPQPVQIPIAYASFGQINAQMPRIHGHWSSDAHRCARSWKWERVEQRRGYAQFVAAILAGVLRVSKFDEHRSRGGGNGFAGGRLQRGGRSIARQTGGRSLSFWHRIWRREPRGCRGTTGHWTGILDEFHHRHHWQYHPGVN